MKFDLIFKDTEITYPSGKTEEKSTIIAVSTLPNDENKIAIFFNKTPFHPIDFRWPDQPADRGYIIVEDQTIAIDNCLVAVKPLREDYLFFDKEIPAKCNEMDGWKFLVAHIVEYPESKAEKLIGKKAILQVDVSYRIQLSCAHTACHLAALALNQVLLEYWSKEFKKLDARGNPDFDSCAILSSNIIQNESKDIYRVGKSLKKKGLDTLRVFSEMKIIENKVNQLLQEWLNLKLKFEVTPENTNLSTRRKWIAVDDKKIFASILCGGYSYRKI